MLSYKSGTATGFSASDVLLKTVVGIR